MLEVIAFGLLNGGVYALLAMGLGLTFGKQNLADLANPAFVVVSAYLTLNFVRRLGINPFLSLALTIPILAATGAAIQLGLINRLLSRPPFEMHTHSALVLFAVSFLVQSLLAIVFTADPQGLQTSFSDSVWQVAGLRLPVVKLMALGLSLAITLSLFLALTQTYYGKAILATYANREVAQLLGINVIVVDVVTYALATALTGFAGLILALGYSFSPSSLSFVTIMALSVAVLGGKGSTIGVLVAGLVVGLVEQITGFTITTTWTLFAIYALLLFMLAVRPTGILGERL
jgi:branched-chain amino acid transport system permease protein